MDEYRIKSIVKKKLESHICSTHAKHPTVTVTNKGFSLQCCCDEFKSNLVALTKEYIGQETKKAIEDELRDAFRN